MSNIGKTQFEFERLCSIFGVSSVRRASIHNFYMLKNLESYLALVEQDIQQRLDRSVESPFSDICSLF